MHGEDMQPNNLLGKRPRELVVGDDHPSPGSRGGLSQTQSERIAEELETPESHVSAWEWDHVGAGCDGAACGGADVISSVADSEPEPKRRKIHVVHYVVEVKVEDEEEDISLFDSSIDAQLEFGSSSAPPCAFQPFEARAGAVRSPRPSATGLQQPTPPSSASDLDGSDTPFAFSSEPTTPTSATGEHPTPSQTPPWASSFFTVTSPPTPPDSPHSPLPEPSLSWPDEVHDFETYKLAAASTQGLIDHCLRTFRLEAGMMSMLPVLE